MNREKKFVLACDVVRNRVVRGWSMVVFICSLVAFQGAALSLSAASLTINIDFGEERDLTAEEKSAIRNNTVDEVLKVGVGTLTPTATSFLGFKGTVRVQAGRLVIQGSNWIPTTARIAVEGNSIGGGSLVFKGSGGTFSTDTPIIFSGVGADGFGALVSDGFTSGDLDLKNTEMAGDALIAPTNTAQSFRFLTSRGLKMNGYTLTYRPDKASELVAVCAIAIPGTIRVEKGTFRPCSGYAQNEGGKVVVAGTGALGVNKFGNSENDTFPWTLETDWSGKMSVKNLLIGSPDKSFQPLDFDLVMADGWTNRLSYGSGSGWEKRRIFSGDFSGIGSIVMDDGKDYGYFVFSGEHAYSGKMIIGKKRYTVLENVKSVPGGDYSRIEIGGGDARLLVRGTSAAYPNGFAASDFLAFMNYSYSTWGETGRQTFLWADGDSPVTLDGTAILDGSKLPSNRANLRVSGGEAKMAVTLENNPKLYVFNESKNDTIALSVPNRAGGQIGASCVRTGTLKFENSGAVIQKDQIVVTSPDTLPRLQIGAGAAVVQDDLRYTGDAGLQYFNIAGWGQYQRGVVEVLRGGTVTNALKLATAATDTIGAVYVREGGEYFNTGRAGYDTAFPAERSHGYIEVDGGVFNTGSGFFIGAVGKSSIGVMYIKGGSFSVRDSNGPHIAREGTGVVYQCGGVLNAPDTLHVGSSSWRNNETALARNGHAAFTLEGLATTATVANAVYAGARGFSDIFVNLREGGTLETRSLNTPLVQPLSGNDLLYRVLSNQTVCVGFDGGRIRANGNAPGLLGFASTSATAKRFKEDGQTIESFTVTGTTVPQHVIVYAGGAKFDTAGYDAVVHAALEAPSVAGAIVALAIPGGTNLVDYIAAPFVEIRGDGIGASAVALFDSATGEVMGVKVVSSGWGYTAANTKAYLVRGVQSSTRLELAVTIGENATTGGLVKEGAGTLTLSAANSYAGVTRIEGGTLKLGNAAALGASKRITLAGGGLDANGKALPDGVVVSLDEDTSWVNGLTGSFKLLSNVSGIVPEISGSENLPPSWRLLRSANGVKITNRGFMIFFK